MTDDRVGRAVRLVGRVAAAAVAIALVGVVAWPSSCDSIASVVASQAVAGDAPAPPARTAAVVSPGAAPDAFNAAAMDLPTSQAVRVSRVASAGTVRTKPIELWLAVVAVLVSFAAFLLATRGRRLRSASFRRRRTARPRGPDPARAPPVPPSTHARRHLAPRSERVGTPCRRDLGGTSCQPPLAWQVTPSPPLSPGSLRAASRSASTHRRRPVPSMHR